MITIITNIEDLENGVYYHFIRKEGKQHIIGVWYGYCNAIFPVIDEKNFDSWYVVKVCLDDIKHLR